MTVDVIVVDETIDVDLMWIVLHLSLFLAQRRKLTASSMAPGIANGNQGVASIHVSLAAPSSQKSLAEEEEGEREEEEEGSGEWNWRENTR